VSNYLKSLGKPFEVVGEFSEIESGRKSARPQLLAALALAKLMKATLCVSRLDRLSRSALFILQLIQDAKVQFVCVDCPSADFLTIGVMAILSQREASLISARTREGLVIARQRLLAEGRRLGNPRPADSLQRGHKSIQERKKAFTESILKPIAEIRETGITSYARIADCLNKRGERGRRGGTWTAKAVSRVLQTSLYLASDESKGEVSKG
jgi:DNA invertase Pin-like site-specific DNA recombinase